MRKYWWIVTNKKSSWIYRNALWKDKYTAEFWLKVYNEQYYTPADGTIKRVKVEKV